MADRHRDSPRAVALELSLYSPRPRASLTDTHEVFLDSLPSVKSSSERLGHRGGWSKHLEFLLSCIGYSIGLGTVWRFPYYCYSHGGGAALIPYIVMMVFVGVPLFYLEISLGQYAGKGPSVIFGNICPAFKGLGVAMLVVSTLVIAYYNILMAWTLFYMFASFAKTLPWDSCQKWSSPDCYTRKQNVICKEMGMTFWNTTCYNISAFCEAHSYVPHNGTHCESSAVDGMFVQLSQVYPRVSSSESYFKNIVLGMNNATFGNIGPISWQLALCLLVAWILVFFCLIKGVYTSGKVVYFTALFPYVLLSILLVRAVTLNGAWDGIAFYIVPNFKELYNVKVWGDAAVQVFYSLGPAFGALLTLASYNRFENNCIKDTLVVALCVMFTSIFVGFIIFAVVGYMATELQLPVRKVVHAGPGLAFIAYPEAMSELAVAPLWSFLFFFTLLILGLDSQFTTVETITTAVQDIWPHLRNYKIRVVSGVCVFCYLMGLVMTTSGGVFILTLLDEYVTKWSVLIIALFECIVVSWIYSNHGSGRMRFERNIEEMFRSRPSLFWTYCWKFIIPLTMVFLIIFQWVMHTPVKYDDYLYPPWADGLGWCVSLVAVICVPVFAIYKIGLAVLRKTGVRVLFVPTADWGPAYESPDYEFDKPLQFPLPTEPVPMDKFSIG